ncbi:hypothetical protein ACFOSC_17125 [Streptantibioticus rubrisoli]|uniref:Uncharacterized protein n=1 Tax=Streptantibioticus rubrisoli TaxID=1387313 RepID=A0ABT1PKM4_9ACTN|nr:hypothetical protein [Streptantibioticus rubrisoli]MCQ4045920.1 hypothetical protein [Streptantibioticus rubrisoli]
MSPGTHPEIETWIKSYTGKLNSVDFLTAHCTVGMWLAMCHLIAPKLVVVRGCVLREHVYEPRNFEIWYRKFDGDRSRVEFFLNRLVVADVIRCGDAPEDDRALRDIAQTLALGWEAALTREFTEERFHVAAFESDDGPIVSFKQISTSQQLEPDQLSAQPEGFLVDDVAAPVVGEEVEDQ